MKKGLIGILIAAVAAVGIFAWVKNAYNSMVTEDENVQSAWSQVENVYQRRADLIPKSQFFSKGCGLILTKKHI